MYADRGIALLAHEDQWARCAHDRTVLLAGGGVGLDWRPVAAPSPWDDAGRSCGPLEHEAACAAGLAYDRWCRAWRTRPLDGSLELTTSDDAPEADCPGGLRHPTGVAVDARDRLYVAESAGRAVMVADLWSGRVLDRVPVSGRPLDVVSPGAATGPQAAIGRGSGAGAYVLTRSPHRVLRIDGAGACTRHEKLRPPCGHQQLEPARIALLSERPVVLWAGDGTAVIADLSGAELLEVPGATDIEGTTSGRLVVALGPGDGIRRFSEQGGALIEDEPLAAEGYDGGAVTLDPSGRVVYTTPGGHRTTQGPRTRHVRQGSVTTYRLDSGTYRTRWARVFVEACLPTGTGLTIRALTTDEDDVNDPRPPAPPARGTRAVRDPDLTPPLPPVDGFADVEGQPVVRRGGALALGGADPTLTGPGWTMYETGVAASPGRYLWLQLELTGTERTSPRVRALRVERPGHALLDALPRMFSSVDEQADFLYGYLSPAESMLHDLDTAAAERRTLVDPQTTPDEFLPWLASFAGLALDLRWPEEARRALLAEVYPLYARRGTQGALERMLGLYLGRDARIVERWRLRGLGGGILGFEPDGGLDSPTVAGTTRRAGMLGHFTIGGALPGTDSYQELAHRFTVLIPGCLTDEQREVVDDLIRAQKPSHTLGDVCELGSGMPVGRLRLGLTAYVAPPRGRATGIIGRARLGGGGAVVGTPAIASRVGETRLGAVRVG